MLTIETRKSLFKYLGLGEYTPSNILKFKKRYLASKYCNSEYDTVAENLLRHCYNVKRHTTNFSPEEFKCKCGKCSGYPSFMKENELKNLQTIRTKYGKPMTITSGMRCKSFNSSLRGSSPTSRHMYGMAADFYIQGVTDTIARRKSLITYMKTLPAHNWSYGNGWCSKGYAVSAPNMGNAVHLDSLVSTTQDRICEWAEKIASDNSYIYVTQNDSDSKTKKCCICQNIPKGSKYHGWNCIRFVGAAFYHGGGVPIKANNHTILQNAFANEMLKATSANALKMWTDRNGGRWQIIRNGYKKLPVSSLKRCDILICYNKASSSADYRHTALYLGSGNIVDAVGKKAGILKRKYTALGAKPLIAMRYIGK